MSQNEMPASVFLRPIQIGLIVKDLDRTLENLQKIFGIGPFRIVDFPPEGHEDIKRVYKGENADFTAKFCFFDLGNIELEIIQPLSGKSIWQDFIDEKGPGLHHIKFNVPEHGPVSTYLEGNGIGITQMGGAVGKNAGKEWVFYDTEEKIGFAIETINEIIK
jgi:methylmalonyl-CoA/ethylmalonyl-CoA epimerase